MVTRTGWGPPIGFVHCPGLVVAFFRCSRLCGTLENAVFVSVFSHTHSSSGKVSQDPLFGEGPERNQNPGSLNVPIKPENIIFPRGENQGASLEAGELLILFPQSHESRSETLAWPRKPLAKVQSWNGGQT